MTDKQFEIKMKKCLWAYLEYKALLEKIEAEYERRFSYNPSDIDDDQWIDLFHLGIGVVRVDEVIAYARDAVELFEKQQSGD